MLPRDYLNRYSDPAIAGARGFAGRDGTFDINLIRAGYAAPLSRISRPRVIDQRITANIDNRRSGSGGNPRSKKHHHRKPQDSFRMGAMRGDFSTLTVVALAVGAYLILK